MIRFDNVYARYPGGGEALRNISFFMSQGNMCFLIGHSSAGKSTLLRVVLKQLTPFRGQVTIDGTDLGNLSRRQLPAFRRRIGVVFQDPQLLPDRTVSENVAIPLMVTGMRRKNRETRVQAALEQVGLRERYSRMPATLSVGEQQRVGIARALVNNPRLVLADEPTGNLDPGLSREILNLFASFNDHGATVLIATHDITLLNEYNKYRTLELQQGKLVNQP